MFLKKKEKEIYGEVRNYIPVLGNGKFKSKVIAKNKELLKLLEDFGKVRNSVAHIVTNKEDASLLDSLGEDMWDYINKTKQIIGGGND